MIFRSSARLLRRIAVTVAGVAVLALGVVLLALPGPGVLVIALGFLILSTEYAWARRYFDTARRKATELAEQAVQNPWSTVLSIAASLALIGAGIVWGAVSAVPFSSWWTGGSLIFGGVVALATILFSLRQARGLQRAEESGESAPAATNAPR